jgi:hypothetical protein
MTFSHGISVMINVAWHFCDNRTVVFPILLVCKWYSVNTMQHSPSREADSRSDSNYCGFAHILAVCGV